MELENNENELFGTLNKDQIKKMISEKELFIEPLLDESQIGAISVDLRVGVDFLMMHQGRSSFVDTTNTSKRNISSHFTESRRKVGQPFLLHPNQTILLSSLEYLKMPSNVYGILSLRSSYSRLGLTISTIIQPGYCGCASIELINNGSIPIKILAGARLFQIRFMSVIGNMEYFETNRKYSCQVKPVPSKANEDIDIEKLKSIIY